MIKLIPIASLTFFLILPGLQAAERPSGSRPGTEIDQLAARVELARVLRNDAQLGQAEAEYRRVLEAAPDMPGVREELAEVLLWQKRPGEARELMKSLDPDNLSGAGLKLMGDLAVQDDEFAEAQQWYERALVEMPDDVKLRFALAESLAWQKKYDASAAHLKALVTEHPEDVQVRRRYAQVLGWNGQNDEAAEQWRLSLGDNAP